jgi:hypothetical protein
MDAEPIIQTIADWAKRQKTILAVAIIGSHARGQARAESDIDFLLLAASPQAFRADTGWLHAINWPAIGARPVSWQDEDYGALWSRRLWLEDKGEIEFGFAGPSWAALDPIDPGTRRVITAGCRILHDPNDILASLAAAISGKP